MVKKINKDDKDDNAASQGLYGLRSKRRVVLKKFTFGNDWIGHRESRATPTR